jgi:hypothetical protein
MLSNWFCRKFKGTAVIHLYDESGEKIKEFAVPEFEERFSWVFFAIIVTLGLAMSGQVV